MRTTKQMSITLPTAMAEAVRERVASGHYASESEVIRAGIRALFAQDEAIKSWLSTQVRESVESIRNGTESLLSSADVRAQLAKLGNTTSPSTEA